MTSVMRIWWRAIAGATENEWRQDAPSRYRKAKDDICYWITDEWYSFESPMLKEIESAYQTALKKKDDLAIALALSPFARKTAELVNSGAYEAAAGSCYTIFRCLAKTCKEHEDWFAGFTGYGDTYTKINLEVFNLETDFFGDLHCSSRFTDMLCDAQAQYDDYSELEKCPMWGMWLKEGGE